MANLLIVLHPYAAPAADSIPGSRSRFLLCGAWPMLAGLSSESLCISDLGGGDRNQTPCAGRPGILCCCRTRRHLGPRPPRGLPGSLALSIQYLGTTLGGYDPRHIQPRLFWA